MNVELAIAGLACFVLAFGHTAVGLRWVLPSLREARLPATPFGSSSMTRSMLRFTWHVVSLMLLGFGVLLMTLAFAPDADPKTLLLRWFAAVQVAATLLAAWDVRRRPSSILRLPVPFVFVVIAAMCWAAST
jgi:hypothetical protein